MSDRPPTATPEPEPDWKYERCAVCLKPFTSKSWDNRHDFIYDRERSVHARCCLCNKDGVQ